MGLLVVISSPSGGGKDSVINELLKILPNSVRLLTTTSRPLRPGNLEGVDYHFVSKEEFEAKIKNNEMVEYNNYAGNYYGIEKARLSEVLNKYDLVFTQIEVNGKSNLDKQDIKHLSFFLLPDSLEILADRIRQRGGVSEDLIVKRLEIAQQEIDKSENYDYRILNKDGKFQQTVEQIKQIIEEKINS